MSINELEYKNTGAYYNTKRLLNEDDGANQISSGSGSPSHTPVSANKEPLTYVDTNNGEFYVYDDNASIWLKQSDAANVASTPQGNLASDTVQLALNELQFSIDSITPTLLTSGSITFAHTDGKITQDNSQLFYNNTNNRFGLGTNNPSHKMQIIGQVRATSFANSNGTEGSPSYRFNSDSNTGMFRAATDQLAFTTAGSEKFRIDNLGNIGIGSNLPLAKLEINGEARLTTVADMGVNDESLSTKKYVDDSVYQKTDKTLAKFIRFWQNGSNQNSGNHIVEIQAKDIYGDILPATATKQDTSTDPKFTDGDLNSSNYISLPAGLTYCQLEFASIVELSSTTIWRYYADARNYFQTKIEISSDGTNWTTIQDSAVNGTYIETFNGFTVGFRVSQEFIHKQNDIISHIDDQTLHLSSGDKDKIDTIVNIDPDSSSIVPSNWFAVSNGSPASSYPFAWGQGAGSNLNGSLNESQIYSDDGTETPSGKAGFIWKCTTNTATGVNGYADGGFNGGYFPIDKTKKHRILIWFRKPNTGTDLHNGTAYLGLRFKNDSGSGQGVLQADNGVNNTNFYGYYGDLTSFNQWHCAVIFVHPSGTAIGLPREGGVYKQGSLTKVANTIRDGIFHTDTAEIMTRAYNFYNTQANNQLELFLPRIEEVNGKEVPLEILLKIPTSHTVTTKLGASEGAMYYDSGLKKWQGYDGTSWVNFN